MIVSLHLPPIGLFCIDPSLGRIDKSALSQQTLMELLVSGFKKTAFQDSDGSYHDISTWACVVMDSDRITAIDWSYDFFDIDENPLVEPGGSIDLQWIPETVTDFNVTDLCMAGSVETQKLPRDLDTLYLSRNRFEGTFSIEGLPQRLNLLNIENNALCGSLDLTCLPPFLETFEASINAFSGSLDLTELPECLRSISLAQNLFEGSVNLEKLPAATTYVQLSGNRLHQEVIRIKSTLEGTAYLRVEKNSFSRIEDENGNEWKLAEVDTSNIVWY